MKNRKLLIRVFYRRDSNEVSPSRDILNGPRPRVEDKESINISEELARLRTEIQSQKNPEELSKLLRKIARLERFEKVKSGVGVESPKKEEIGAILKDKSFDTFLASDLGVLRNRGVDLVYLLLTSPDKPEELIASSTLKVGDKLVVNFGKNPELKKKVGAGDILPPEVTKVKIGDVEYERRDLPRPGYYNDAIRPKYGRIFDGTSMEIIAVGPLKPESKTSATNALSKRGELLRIQDTRANNGEALTTLPEDIELAGKLKKEADERRERREKYRGYKAANLDEFMEKFGSLIAREEEYYDVPKGFFVKHLLASENRQLNPNIKNPKSTAYGLTQMIGSTWIATKANVYRARGIELERDDPEDQIIAGFDYLAQVKNLKNCSWEDALIYYHTGPGFGGPRYSQEDLNTAVAVNGPIAKHMIDRHNPTIGDYWQAARKYYKVDGNDTA